MINNNSYMLIFITKIIFLAIASAIRNPRASTNDWRDYSGRSSRSWLNNDNDYYYDDDDDINNDYSDYYKPNQQQKQEIFEEKLANTAWELTMRLKLIYDLQEIIKETSDGYKSFTDTLDNKYLGRRTTSTSSTIRSRNNQGISSNNQQDTNSNFQWKLTPRLRLLIDLYDRVRNSGIENQGQMVGIIRSSQQNQGSSNKIFGSFRSGSSSSQSRSNSDYRLGYNAGIRKQSQRNFNRGYNAGARSNSRRNYSQGFNAGQQSQIRSNEGRYNEGFGDGSRSQSRINNNRDQIKYNQGFLDGQKENVDQSV